MVRKHNENITFNENSLSEEDARQNKKYIENLAFLNPFKILNNENT